MVLGGRLYVFYHLGHATVNLLHKLLIVGVYERGSYDYLYNMQRTLQRGREF